MDKNDGTFTQEDQDACDNFQCAECPAPQANTHLKTCPGTAMEIAKLGHCPICGWKPQADEPCERCGGMRSVPYGAGISQPGDEYDACPDCADAPELIKLNEFKPGRIAPEPVAPTTEQRARWVEYKLGHLHDGAETGTAKGSWIIALLKGEFDGHIRAWLTERDAQATGGDDGGN